MRKTQEIREEVSDLRDELEAIVAVADREERDLTDEESTRVAEITDTEIPRANKQLKASIKIDKERLNRASTRFNEELDRKADQQAADNTLPTGPRFKIPAKAKRHGNLQAFTGPDAEQDAYVAGQVCLAGLFNHAPAQAWCIEHGYSIKNTMLTNDNAQGGFLVPEEMQATIIRLREERGVFGRYANRIPMGADIITIPRLLADTTAYWPGEGAEITASDGTLGAAELMARKLASLVKVSRELDMDSVISIGDMLTQSMAYAQADKIDEAGFNGDGTSTYGGFKGLKNVLNASAIYDAASGNTGALTLDLADFEGAAGLLGQYPGATPAWFMHSAVFWASAARLQMAAGGNMVQQIAGGPQMMFMGYPVVFTQVLTSTTGAAASTILAYFGDLRLGCAYGVRESLRTEVTLDRYFENDLIGIKTVERIAVLCHEDGATIRTRPVVALKTAAS